KKKKIYNIIIFYLDLFIFRLSKHLSAKNLFKKKINNNKLLFGIKKKKKKKNFYLKKKQKNKKIKL
ncbi:hypothetical protein ACSTH6_00470, partial [Vibrio parahaemolyticus]